MAFTPRTFQAILDDMIAYVQSTTELSDYTVGSVIRTILEAAALEDDEQYFQMVQLLDAFSMATATGEDLDLRLSDFNISRREATTSTGHVVFRNGNLTTDLVSIEASVGAVVLFLFSTDDFPTSGYPYTARIAEGTPRTMDVTVLSNDTVAGTLTLDPGTPLSNSALVGDRCSLVTGSAAITINSGMTVQTAPSVGSPVVSFSTREPGFILAGNFESNQVAIKAVQSGESGNVGSGRVSQFSGAPPFVGASVTNLSATGGGNSLEADSDFRQRGVAHIQSLSKGTPNALVNSAIGVEDATTGQRVVSANIVEDYVNDEVIVYIDDGTGFSPDISTLTQDSLNGALVGTETSITVFDNTDFPSTGWILIEEDGTNDAEVLQYSSTSSGNTLNLVTAVVGPHDSGSIVSVVKIITDSAETGQRRFRVPNRPIVRATDRFFILPPASTVFTQLATTDYTLNKGTGELLINAEAGLLAGTLLVASYSYYTNLIASVQEVLEGNPDDPTNYPGVKAAGTFLAVETPISKRITVNASITAETNFSESDLSPLVQRALDAYINSLGIGEDAIISKMIDAAHNVSGLASIIITEPLNSVVVLENELPVTSDSSGNSLITVV